MVQGPWFMSHGPWSVVHEPWNAISYHNPSVFAYLWMFILIYISRPWYQSNDWATWTQPFAPTPVVVAPFALAPAPVVGAGASLNEGDICSICLDPQEGGLVVFNCHHSIHLVSKRPPAGTFVRKIYLLIN